MGFPILVQAGLCVGLVPLSSTRMPSKKLVGKSDVTTNYDLRVRTETG